MRVEEVDERDSSWEVGEPRFRIYLFRPPHMATATYDLTGTDVEGAIRWARDAAGSDRLFSVALLHDEGRSARGRERGLIWILGTDANVSDPSPGEHAALDGMWGRLRDAQSAERSALDLARRVAERCRLSGSFTLRSGRTATTYFDKYLFEGDPALLREVAEQMAPLVPDGTEVLAGLELGGVPVATALSLATGLPAAFVRKEAKTHGTAKLAEGTAVEGRRVLVVEDVVTTGGQVAASTADLRSRGAIVHDVLCVLDRSEGQHRPLDEAALALRALFTMDELGV